MDADNVIIFDAPALLPRPSAATMKTELIEQASEIISDPHILVNILSKRVDQLNTGRSPLVNALPSTGFADIALMEIIEGKIKLREKS